MLLSACSSSGARPAPVGLPAPNATGSSGIASVSPSPPVRSPTGTTVVTPALVFTSGQLASAETLGAWSEPFVLPVTGIHATLLRTGEVLLFAKPGDTGGSLAWVWNPQTRVAEDVTLAYDRDLFCAGHTVLPDGRLLVSGGHAYGADGHGDGAAGQDIFDPVAKTWTAVTPLNEARWYPSLVELGSGKTLIFGGQESNERTIASTESYDYSTGVVDKYPESADNWMDDYPRMHLLTDGTIATSGEDADTWRFDPEERTWSDLGKLRASTGRVEGSTVLLPGLTTLLAFGGQGGDVTNKSAETIDFSEPDPQWEWAAPMKRARMNANGVLLPDGTVFVSGGGKQYPYEEPVTQAERFDPKTGEWTEMSSQKASRMYHATAILLPDGSVLSSGQDFGPHQFTGEIYKPPYLFAGARPAAPSAPTEISYGDEVSVGTSSDTSELVLVRPGSVTHSVDFDQRYVRLSGQRSGDAFTVTAPEHGNIAPPGWYMLFALSAKGTPSVASWVHLT